MRSTLLKRFIAQTLITPKSVLAAQFRNEDDVTQAIGIQPDTARIYEKISPELLQQLHLKLRKSRVENAIWSCLIWHLKNALPSEVAHDLIDRKIAPCALGHSRQNDDVQWRMATFYSEALLTLALDRYTQRKHTTLEFNRVLELGSSHDWMMSALSHNQGSSKAKTKLFLEAAKKHPDAKRLLETHENMTEGREWWREQEKTYQNQLLQAAHPEITDEQARELYKTYDWETCTTLIKNRQLSDTILQELTQLRGFTGARQIRGDAKSELNRRRQIRERDALRATKNIL